MSSAFYIKRTALWLVGLFALVLAAGMAWSLGSSLGVTEGGKFLTGLGWGFLMFFPTLLHSSVRRAHQLHYSLSFIALAAAFTLVFGAFRVATVMTFVLLEVAEYPAHQGITRGAITDNPRGNLTGGVPGPDKIGPAGGRLGSALQPSVPAPSPASPRRPGDELAGILAVDPTMVRAAFSLAVALAWEFLIASSLVPAGARARCLRPLELQRPRAETVAPAKPSTPPIHARDAGNRLRTWRTPSSQRIRQRERAAALLAQLERCHHNDVVGIEVQPDGWLLCSNRKLAALLHCGPGSINVALHLLQAAGRVQLEPEPGGTRIRLNSFAGPSRTSGSHQPS